MAAVNELTLDSVCLSFRKVPYVTNFEIVDLILSIFINSRDADFPSVDISPFCLHLVSRRTRQLKHGTRHTMPMELPY